jgi:hypothetical protein
VPFAKGKDAIPRDLKARTLEDLIRKIDEKRWKPTWFQISRTDGPLSGDDVRTLTRLLGERKIREQAKWEGVPGGAPDNP